MSKTNYVEYYERNAFIGKIMGIFTSGEDSQGMNAAVRASVRTALYFGIKIYIIKEGYCGMVKGGDYIYEASWIDVSSIIHLGGTKIGSARSEDFRTRDGRLKAAYNLVKKGINNLVVIGGDGSLTGANLFRQEWSDLLDELLRADKINYEERTKYNFLLIVGIVGSIDNDFCGTDMTIGADSALHRIMEVIDAMQNTPYDHQRASIVEVMGRQCGFLALSAALSCGATLLFIPEDPVGPDWRNEICEKLSLTRARGQRINIIIVAEGAIDSNGIGISAEEIKNVVTKRLNMETSVSILGHIQRGGNPTAFDRILACRMGHEAVLALASTSQDSESIIVSLQNNATVRKSLRAGVQKTKCVAKAMAIKDFSKAVELRGRSFKKKLNTFKLLSQYMPSNNETRNGIKIACYRLAMVHIGSPSCGMNAASRSFTRCSLNRGYQVFGINDGIVGLIAGQFVEMKWSSVSLWASKGGSALGTKLVLPEGKFKEIAERLRQFKIDGLLIIGGFEAYHACGQLAEERCNYPEFRIPLVVIPATISNNIPGTEFSLGSDTALNVICEICDSSRQYAQGTRRRVFIIETMGDKCGYLATFAAFASGADASYIFEEKYSLKDLQKDVQNMIHKMDAGVSRGLILRNENASKNYNTDFVYRVFSEEGKGKFTTKMNILGHMQQGSTTTPFDRILGIRLGASCVQWFAEQIKKNMKPDGTINCVDNDSACLLGVIQRDYNFTPMADLLPETDFDNRVPKYQWWLKLRPMIHILCRHHL